MVTPNVIDLTRDETERLTYTPTYSPGSRDSMAEATATGLTRPNRSIPIQPPKSRKRKLDSNPQASSPDRSPPTALFRTRYSDVLPNTPQRPKIKTNPFLGTTSSTESSPSSGLRRQVENISLRRPEAEQESTPSKRQKYLSIQPIQKENLTQPLPGTDTHPIEIDEDEDDLAATVHNAYSGHLSSRRISKVPDLHTLGNRNSKIEDDDENTELFSDSSDSSQHGLISEGDYAEDYELPEIIKRLSIVREKQEKNITEGRTELAGYKGKGHDCAKGKSVELDDGTFMRIMSIMRKGNSETFIRGHLLVREDSQTPTMPRRHNELVWVQPQGPDRIGFPAAPVLSEVSVAKVRRNRDIVFTNQRYPNVSAKHDNTAFDDTNQGLEYGPLFCRWRRIVIQNNKDKVLGESFQHLLFRNADSKVRRSKTGEEIFPRIADSRARSEWRQSVTHLGGSHRAAATTHDLVSGKKTQRVHKYTFGDAFCGAGGTSRGAIDAGLHVKWGFDHNGQAMGSYRANFARGGTDCREEAVDEFLTEVSAESVRVDILHASPPCQPYSPAKTHLTPEQDEKNEACLFSVGQLLSTAKPRVVTMEETDGLVSRHQPWFQALIHIFIHVGYSVRWQVINMKHYGVPQNRKRLVIIASGPGETLPPFPRPTHGDEGTSMRPFVTIGDSINNIRPDALDHNLDTVCEFDNPKAPFSSAILAKTLTCSGGIGNYHPSGLRHYTIRERACLQTFPAYHLFTGAPGITAKTKQIGNAVPPAFARALFKAISKSLRDSDEEKLRMSKIGLVDLT